MNLAVFFVIQVKIKKIHTALKPRKKIHSVTRDKMNSNRRDAAQHVSNQRSDWKVTVFERVFNFGVRTADVPDVSLIMTSQVSGLVPRSLPALTVPKVSGKQATFFSLSFRSNCLDISWSKIYSIFIPIFHIRTIFAILFLRRCKSNNQACCLGIKNARWSLNVWN